MTQIGGSSRRHSVALPGGGRVTLAWTSLSDRGHRRSINEDSLIAKPGLFAVADGMGGHTAGDFASAAVVTRLAEEAAPPLTPEAVLHALTAAVEDIGTGVGPSELGTGTTVTGVGLAVEEGLPQWLVFNIGDSRVYTLHDSSLTQLTVDHSVVQELIDAGKISADEADTHPHANVITRAVGFNEEPAPDFSYVPIDAGMRLLVTSDGLTKELTDQGLKHFLGEGQTTKDAAQRLVDAALGNGGRDNVTAIVVDVLAVD